MIEAVNSIASNAAFLKPAVEQQSVAASYAANPQNVQKAALAPYLSLYVKVDVNYNQTLLLMRDGETGDVVRQIPSENQLEAYRRAQAVVQPQPKENAPDTAEPQIEQVSTQQAAPVSQSNAGQTNGVDASSSSSTTSSVNTEV